MSQIEERLKELVSLHTKIKMEEFKVIAERDYIFKHDAIPTQEYIEKASLVLMDKEILDMEREIFRINQELNRVNATLKGLEPLMQK